MKRKAFAKASRHEHILVGLALSLFILLWGAADLAAVDERYRKLLIFPSPNTTTDRDKIRAIRESPIQKDGLA